jgi:hypothetical protein
MRVSFDSNAWEKIFSPADCKCAPLRAALKARRLDGFICEAAFRIEAIRKRDRADYFKQPHADLQFDRIVTQNGRSHLEMSFGPLDDHHLGLHGAPVSKLQGALAAGIRLMRGSNWMGLPSPQEIRDPTIFVPERLRLPTSASSANSTSPPLLMRAALVRRNLTRPMGGATVLRTRTGSVRHVRSGPTASW